MSFARNHFFPIFALHQNHFRLLMAEAANTQVIERIYKLKLTWQKTNESEIETRAVDESVGKLSPNKHTGTKMMIDQM